MVPLADDAWLVQKRGSRGARLEVERLAKGVWLVQRRRFRRAAHRIGSPAAGTHVLVDEARARRSFGHQQTQLGHYAGNQHLVGVLERLGVNCVLDVGANSGQFGTRIREAGYAGRIVSFEPLGHIAEQMRPLAEADHDWRVVQCALGDEEGEAEMNVVADKGRTSSLLPASEYGLNRSRRLAGVRTETVPVRRLDRLLDDAVAGIDDPRVFLKMDTQGFDLRVFRGAGDRIKEVLGLQSEVACLTLYDGMPRYLEAIAAYEQAGFEVTGMFPVTAELDTLRVLEFDVVMVRAEEMTPPRR